MKCLRGMIDIKPIIFKDISDPVVMTISNQLFNSLAISITEEITHPIRMHLFQSGGGKWRD